VRDSAADHIAFSHWVKNKKAEMATDNILNMPRSNGYINDWPIAIKFENTHTTGGNTQLVALAQFALSDAPLSLSLL
jgi:hypothetical protein